MVDEISMVFTSDHSPLIFGSERLRAYTKHASEEVVQIDRLHVIITKRKFVTEILALMIVPAAVMLCNSMQRQMLRIIG